jgi:hypothetical protein
MRLANISAWKLHDPATRRQTYRSNSTMSHALATDNCFWPTGCADRCRCNGFGQCVARWQAEHKREIFNGPSTGESPLGLKETSPGSLGEGSPISKTCAGRWIWPWDMNLRQWSCRCGATHPTNCSAMTPAKPDRELDGHCPDPELDDDGLCPVCGSDGFIMAADGDGSDWGEDTYSGPDDEVIQCRHCNGTGAI